MICPICGLLMGNIALNVFTCPQGHYRVQVTLGFATGTSPLTLSAQFPRNWEDEPIKIPVPQPFHDAFRDVEVIEP